MGDASAVDKAVFLSYLIVGVVTIALDDPVRTLEQPCRHFVAPARIVVEEDDPLPWGTGNSYPHPVFGGCRLLAVDDLHRRFIDADVAAAAQPLIHQVNQWLDPLGKSDDPGRLRGPR